MSSATGTTLQPSLAMPQQTDSPSDIQQLYHYNNKRSLQQCKKKQFILPSCMNRNPKGCNQLTEPTHTDVEEYINIQTSDDEEEANDDSQTDTPAQKVSRIDKLIWSLHHLEERARALKEQTEQLEKKLSSLEKE